MNKFWMETEFCLRRHLFTSVKFIYKYLKVKGAYPPIRDYLIANYLSMTVKVQSDNKELMYMWKHWNQR